MRWFVLFFVMSFLGWSQQANVVTTLPVTINETSALLQLNNRYYTLNDSGNSNQLFEFDTSTGAVLRTITISNATNVDWEALAADDTHVYIGDIGNNSGDRTNLTIYKISISDLENLNTITSTSIAYSYNDQVDFTSNPFNTNFDAEALIATDSNLYIFSKQWIDEQSAIYQLDKTSSTQSAINVGTLATNGLVTDAFITSDGNKIAFCGYNVGGAYLWELENYSGTDFTSGNLTKFTLTLPAGNSSQIEGITQVSATLYYLTSELFATLPPTLYSVDFSTLSTSTISATALKVFPNPTPNQLFFNSVASYSLYDVTGVLLQQGNASSLSLAHFAQGVYMLVLQNNNEKVTFKVIKKDY